MRREIHRDFHLVRPEKPNEDLRSMYDLGIRPFWEAYGSELFVELVTKLRSSDELRQQVIADTRRAWWTVRHQGKGAMRTKSGRGAITLIIETYELLTWAGYEPFDLHQLTNCLSSQCTCEGCDLADGCRFHEPPTAQ